MARRPAVVADNGPRTDEDIITVPVAANLTGGIWTITLSPPNQEPRIFGFHDDDRTQRVAGVACLIGIAEGIMLAGFRARLPFGGGIEVVAGYDGHEVHHGGAVEAYRAWGETLAAVARLSGIDRPVFDLVEGGDRSSAG